VAAGGEVTLRAALIAAVAPLCLAASPAPQAGTTFDVLIKGGTVYDGSGGAPRRADVGIRGDRIAAVGGLGGAEAPITVDASGLAVAPGFINMLSWSTESLLVDGRSQGEVREGVTTQVFGEGESMGPWSEPMKARRRELQGDLKYDIAWTSLAEYLVHLERKGVSQNVASFVGAATVREHVVGLENRAPTAAQMEEMRELVRKEMEAGALGVGSSLIYAPALYASTEELIELSKVAARYQGKYISHMRSEGDRLLEAVDELIRIAREAGIPAEIYHLKAAGEANWPKMDQVIERVEAARREGLRITADMYTYTAGATGFDACLPPWAREGDHEALFRRLRDPETRKRLGAEIGAKGDGWENLCVLAGGPERALLLEFKSAALKPLQGKTLAEVARSRGQGWTETVMDLILEDRTRVGVAFFLMSEENIRKQIRLPWVCFGSDAASMAPGGVFLKSSSHPRAYGNFARLLGKYVREEKLIPLAEAVRRLSGLPATNLGLDRRGFLKPGMFADLVVFDPARVADRATFEKPHQYSVGMRDVFVNGVAVLKDGEHTGATPGRALWGPGRVPLSSTSPAGDVTLGRLEREIVRLSEAAGGSVGASVLHLETGRRVSLRRGERFPMASTFKVPVAVQLLERVDRGELSLDQMVTIRPRDLHPGSGTLASLFNKPGVALSLRNLLELMLLISDNSATDLALEAAGGAAAVTARMRALGIEGIDVSRPTIRLIADWAGWTLPDESEWSPELYRKLAEAVTAAEAGAAHARFDADPRDTSTPDAMVALLERIHRKDLLKPGTAALLLDVMLRCQTGEARLKGILPAGTPVAHKTGTIGGTTNDVGIVTLPDGAGHLALAIFVKSSGKAVAARERVIAELARAAHDFFLFHPRP
jgi:N-acyl-D-amino-acid deacylase